MLITGIVYILNLFLKMLIIFAGTPTAAPGEAMLYKKLVSKVGFVDLIRKILFSVRIGFAPGGGDIDRAVLAGGDVGVVEGIQVNGKAVGMVGKSAGGKRPVVKAGCIIVFHGQFIIPLIFLHKTYFQIGRAHV